ncbi:hypothetical protein PoB_001071100 [Plakobranchus ocellatus]|uniref:Uncharacterized protein n=1 Tax=Plakobranchus ocellatus TaxID=259542 RepID=A0AAV3YP70_9GAST|nr:hypothetical protein PoB_001071100 [Plakobranchus ocellatus]
MSGCFNFAPGTSFSSNTTACDMLKRLREDTDRKWSSKVMTYIRFIRQQSNWADIQTSSTAAAIGPDSCPSRVVMLIESFAPPLPFLLTRFTFCIIINLVGQVGLAKKMVCDRDWSGILCRSIGQDPVFSLLSRPLLNFLYPHR